MSTEELHNTVVILRQGLSAMAENGAAPHSMGAALQLIAKYESAAHERQQRGTNDPPAA